MRVTCPVKLTREAITLTDGRQLLPSCVGFRSLYRTKAHRPYRLRISKQATRSSLLIRIENDCFYYNQRRPDLPFRTIRIKSRGQWRDVLCTHNVKVVLVVTDTFRQLIAPLNPNKQIYVTLENMP